MNKIGLLYLVARSDMSEAKINTYINYTIPSDDQKAKWRNIQNARKKYKKGK